MMRVAVLRGGVGDEHDVSMLSGSAVLKHLSSENESSIRPLDIFVDRSGDWIVRGVKQSPERALAAVDVVWNALHGQYGEDGELQRILDRIGIPYTGSRAYGSSLAMNKVLTKRELEKSGVLTPHSVVFGISSNLDEDIVSAFRSFPLPSIIKPSNSGSSVGVNIARSYHDFDYGVREAFKHSPQVLIEELVLGKEATVGVVDQFRDQPLYALPPVEIITDDSSPFFDYGAKYSGETEERCPGNFTSQEIKDLQTAALTAHNVLRDLRAGESIRV